MLNSEELKYEKSKLQRYFFWKKNKDKIKEIEFLPQTQILKSL